MLLMKWIGQNQKLAVPREELDEIDKFRYLEGYTSPVGRISDEIYPVYRRSY